MVLMHVKANALFKSYLTVRMIYNRTIYILEFLKAQFLDRFCFKCILMIFIHFIEIFLHTYLYNIVIQLCHIALPKALISGIIFIYFPNYSLIDIQIPNFDWLLHASNILVSMTYVYIILLSFCFTYYNVTTNYV